MLSIWATVGLIFGGLVLAGIAWFVVLVIGKAIFEDLLGAIIGKFRRKRAKKDRYIY